MEAVAQLEIAGGSVTVRNDLSSGPRWLLILPLIFFAAHGAFSFQFAGNAGGVFMPSGAADRNPGFVGYVILPALAYSVVLWLIMTNWAAVVAVAANFKLLTVLTLITLCSAVWSQNPMRSAVFATLYVVCTLFAYALVVRLDPEELMHLLTWAGIIICALSLFMVIFFPVFGLQTDDPRTMGAWRGIFIDRTGAAKEMVFLLSAGVVGWRSDDKPIRWLSILVLSMMVLRAEAVTGFISIALCTIFVLFIRLNRKFEPRFSRILILAFLVASSLLAFLGTGPLDTALHLFGRDPTLSGRTAVWHAIWGAISLRPFLGYGYYAFWQQFHGESANIATAINWTADYAHNGILEIWLQVGLVGVLVFLGTLLQALRNAWFCLRFDRTGRYDWYVALLFLMLVYNIDEETLLFPNELLSILYVITCCGLAKAAWEIKRGLTSDFAKVLNP